MRLTVAHGWENIDYGSCLKAKGSDLMLQFWLEVGRLRAIPFWKMDYKLSSTFRPASVEPSTHYTREMEIEPRVITSSEGLNYQIQDM